MIIVSTISGIIVGLGAYAFALGFLSISEAAYSSDDIQRQRHQIFSKKCFICSGVSLGYILGLLAQKFCTVLP